MKRCAQIALVLLFVSTFVGLALPAQAEVTLTFEPDADAQAVADAPDETFGSLPSIAADGWPEIESFVRFAVAGLDGKIERATLRVYALSSGDELPTISLADNDWDENDLTWNTRPDRKSKRKHSEGATGPNRWVEFDVTSLVKREGIYTFNLDNDSGDRLTMASRESDNVPQLVIVGDGRASPTSPATSTPQPGTTPTPGSPPDDDDDDDTQAGAGPWQRGGKTWYVAQNGSNGDGTSFGTAWRELNRIRWERIRPGDTIRIARGTYRETLDVDADGVEGRPIRILFEPGSQLFGGRTEPLPNCHQQSYTYRAGGGRGIDLRGSSFVIVDGQRWGGLEINGWQRGVDMDESSHHLTVRNVEITDNGVARRENVLWEPAEEGVQLGGARIVLFEHVDIHDNGVDAFQATGDIREIVFHKVWMHNDRGSEYNGCNHPDGLQVNTGYRGDNITMKRVVSGPHVYHTVLSPDGADWTFQDVLAFAPITSPFACRRMCQNWSLNRVTSDGRDGKLNIELAGKDHQITNSIITNGHNRVPGSTETKNNIQHKVGGPQLGTKRDPRFRDPQDGDFTPLADVNGAGSRITSPEDLR